MDKFTVSQIEKCKNTIAVTKKLLEIEQSKSNPNQTKILRWQNTLAQQEGILRGLEGDKNH